MYWFARMVRLCGLLIFKSNPIVVIKISIFAFLVNVREMGNTELFFFICFIQSIFTAFALFMLPEKKLPNRLLSLHVIVWGLLCYYRYSVFQNADYILQHHFILKLDQVIELLLFVFVYLYIKYLTIPPTKFKKIDLLHFLPATIALLLYSKYIFLSGEEKINIVLSGKPSYYTIVADIIYYFSMLQGVIYTILSAKLTKKYHLKIRNNYSNIEKRTIHWLINIILMNLIILLTVNVINLFIDSELYNKLFDYLFIFIGLSVFMISYYIITQNLLFNENFKDYNPVIQWSNEISKEANLQNNSIEVDDENVENSGLRLEPEYCASVIDKLNQVMINDKIFLYQDLNLNLIAQKIDIPRHHISSILNNVLSTTFFDYINKFRVEEAKKMIVDSKNYNITLIAIGAEAGFNSTATFYRNFKKHEKMTPLEYKQRISKEDNE